MKLSRHRGRLDRSERDPSRGFQIDVTTFSVRGIEGVLNHSYSVPEVKLHLESLQLDPCLESGVLQIEEGFLKFQIQSAVVVVLLIARAFQGGIHILEV